MPRCATEVAMAAPHAPNLDATHVPRSLGRSMNILARLGAHGSMEEPGWALDCVDCLGVRVVHGGSRFRQPAEIARDLEGG